MSITFRVATLTFSSGATIDLNPGEIVVLVGPNNCGKSETLAAIERKAAKLDELSPVVESVGFEDSGSYKDCIDWLEANCIKRNVGTANETYSKWRGSIQSRRVEQFWTSSKYGQLKDILINNASTESRLSAANPAQQIARLKEPFTHPIHYLQDDDKREKKISDHFNKAFGKDLIVHPGAGSQVPLYCGARPKLDKGETLYSTSWFRKLEMLDLLHEQGDGMRSFAGTLLQATVDKFFVMLIDEPEAFLHPPQARLLGEVLVRDKGDDGQLFLATHSGDFLRGLLNADSNNVRVIRIRREEDVNYATQLDTVGVKEFWSDPLLRYSDLLDGLFHERVVVCEADSDCQFYEAILDAICDSVEDNEKPDLKFTHCGGKYRIPLVVKSLRALDVPISVIVDFDVLSETQPLKDIVTSVGGDWSTVEPHWKVVKDSIDNKKPHFKLGDVKTKISEIFDKVEGDTLPDKAIKEIRDAMKGTTSWQIAKQNGKSWVPSGQPTVRCNALLGILRQLGIFVVPVGEQESFCKSVGGHGPKFNSAVLQKDLANDPELADARNFVSGLIKA